MITLINGTNAPSSCARAITEVYESYLAQKNVNYVRIDLKEMPIHKLAEDMYYNKSPAFKAWQEKYIFPAEKFIIVIPEYNGSIPGIFKLMLDATDIEPAWWGKKACITGFSSGRAGNLSGLGHLTHILNYLKINVHYNKIPISKVQDLMDEDRQLTHMDTVQLIHDQVDQLVAF